MQKNVLVIKPITNAALTPTAPKCKTLQFNRSCFQVEITNTFSDIGSYLTYGSTF